MTVKEIIMLACEMIGEDGTAEKIKNQEEFLEEEENLKNDLLKCFNFVQNEIATEYFPLVTKEKIKAIDGAFEISKLKERLAYIVSFKDKCGEKIKHKIMGGKIFFEGEVEIEYCYCPTKKTLEDICEIALPERVVASGVLREYYLLQGLANEATVFEAKFKNSLANFAGKKCLTSMPKPIWK